MLLTAAAMVPIMGGLAVAVDYTEMARQRQETLNALDAAGIAAARRLVEGATDAQVKTYAKDFFEANLGSVKPKNTLLSIVLPKDNTGGGTLKMSAELKYEPYFFPTFASLIGKGDPNGDMKLDFKATSEVKLKNTLEIALVLDNSGSMEYTGSGSGKKRMVLLKEAAKQLVDTISAEAQQMKQLAKPVQFGLVPFAASVNVGPTNRTKSWMDANGLSPIHHENFTYPNVTSPTASAMYTQVVAGITYARGAGWASLTDGWKTMKDKPLTRWSFYDNVKRRTGTANGLPTYSYIAWEGCVEARPYPYNVNDAAATTATPATLFVPMFAPDEPGNVWTRQSNNTVRTFSTENSWWDDNDTSTATDTTTQLARQKKATKYFVDMPQATNSMPAAHEGPNASCTTNPILPLTDVSTTAGVTTVKTAIDAMASNGATNVPEGMAWGWRVVSSGEPFTEGRSEVEKGNDKVVIVLTDGANTYYTPSSLGFTDAAGVGSTYSAYGYTKQGYNGTTTTRLFMNTSSAVVKSDLSNANYTKALNEHFTALCTNAKAAGVIVMTVSLDLSSTDTTEKAQIDALKACSSDSRFRKGADGKPAKLYWNSTGSNLATSFKEIADELSNLRIVG
ncbi:MAG: vWA domain-containing protein [Rhizobiaceae bacterium]